MKRAFALLAALVVGFLLLVPVALAADDVLPHTGRVILSTGGDVTIPSGEHADAVIVIDGTATIGGEVNTVVVIEGRAILTDARAETVVAVRSPIELAGSTVVLGDVMTLDSVVERGSAVQVDGTVRDVASDLAGIGFVLASALLLLYIGFAIAAIAAGLLLAALAAKQVRTAESLIRTEPVLVIVAGALGTVVPIVLVMVLTVTVVGAPLAFGILLGLWPIAAFLGYLVAGIAIGDWILAKTSPGVVRERPYLAAVVGIVILQVMGIVPPLSAIATFVGFGAVLLAAWRVITARPHGSSAPAGPPAAAQLAG
ncbi:MAG: hypothetical protein ACXWXA_10775 [Candidatus Limnocylindrales bacterium]